MIRWRPVLTLIVLTALHAGLLADYTLTEEYTLNADRSGLARLTFRIESALLELRKAAGEDEKLRRRFPLDDPLARRLADEAGVTLSSYSATAGQAGPALPDGQAVDYTRIQLEYRFPDVQSMRVYFPRAVEDAQGKPVQGGFALFEQTDRETLKRKLSPEELDDLKNFIGSLPAERKTYFVLISPAVNPLAPVQLPPGTGPRDAEGYQYRIGTVIHFPQPVAATNGYHVQDGSNTVQWEYPLLPMQNYRMIYAVRLGKRSDGRNWLAASLVAVGTIVVAWALLRHRTRRQPR